MPTATPKILTAVEAARWIYGAAPPSQEQVDKVVKKIETGDLARSPRGGHTTTAAAVAEYIARRESTRGSVYRGEGDLVRRQPVAGVADEAFTDSYQGVVKDIVLAALLRQKVKHRSPLIQRAVAATQGLLLLAAVGLLVGLSVVSFGLGGQTPQQRVAKQWLLRKYPDSQIQELKMLKDPPQAVRARFRHDVQEKSVESELILIVRNSQVVTSYSAAR